MTRPDTSTGDATAVLVAPALAVGRAMARRNMATLASEYEHATAEYFHGYGMRRVAIWTGAPDDEEIDAALSPLNVWGL